VGDLGGESALKDRRAEERAIREGWNVPQAVRQQVIDRLADVVNPATEEGAKAELRYVVQAAKTLAAADLRQQALHLERDKLERGEPVEGTLVEVAKLVRERLSQAKQEDHG